MKKALKIIIIIVSSLCALFILFAAGIYAYLFIGQSMVEKNVIGKQEHITEIKEFEKEFTLPALPTDCVTDCDCYYTVDAADMLTGVDCCHLFGRMKITRECYDNFLNEYNDFREQRGIPDLQSLYQHGSLYYDDMADFVNSAANKDFLFSSGYFNANNIILLLSADEPEIWFCEIYLS